MAHLPQKPQMKEKEARNRISKAVLHLCPQNSKTTNVKSKNE